MAGPDGVINIGADGSAFTKAVKAIEKNTDTMANSISARLARMGQAFQGLSAAGNMVSHTISGFTGPAAEVEDAATALAIMLDNDTEAAYRLADSLQMLAANGKVGMLDLYGAARALTNVYQDAGSLERWVAVFADIAAGSKLSAERLGEFVAKLHDSGKAEFAELANAGIPIFEVLGEITGQNAAELQRMGAAGEVSVGLVLDAFERLTAAGGKYHAMNASLSNTTRGSFETLQASIAACAGVLGTPINDALRPMLQEVSIILQEMRPQLARVAGELGEFLQGAASMAGPVLRAVAMLAEHFLDVGHVVGFAVGGLVVYSAHANRAAAATFTFSGALGGLVSRIKGLKLWGVFSSWGKAVAAAKGAWSGLCGFMHTSWKSTCITLAATFKAACVAMKSALLSTGVGLLVWGIGEGVSALYNYFAGVDDEAKNAAGSARRFKREMADLKKQAANVRTETDMAATLEEGRRKAEDLKEAIAEAQEEGNEAAAKQLRGQRDELLSWLAVAEKQMDVTVAKERKAAAARAAMAEEKKLAEETLKAEQERLQTMKELAAQRADADFERMLERVRANGGAGASEDIIAARLQRVGVASVMALRAEVNALEKVLAPSETQLARYRLLADVLAKIEEEEGRIEERQRTAADEQGERRKNYAERRRTYEEGRADEQYKGMSVGQQERELERRARAAGYWGDVNADGLRAHLDALADAGAKSNEKEIAALERVLELHGELLERRRQLARLKYGNMQELRIAALEAAGDTRGAERLREKMTQQQRIKELQEAGYSAAAAQRQAGREAKVRQAQTLAERMQNRRVEWVKTSLASVGGGVSRRLGDGQLSEARKHSSLLKEIRDILTGTKGAYAILS